ncbi:hypothetical protein [Microbulbifer pacificus]|uniref:hypothetical protein n=1 Tax=Microbulbifer pacificus TaxID=407164 RepID=UPI000CF56BF4|nr:hypothetical protein [Microbulbifer pacificus]
MKIPEFFILKKIRDIKELSHLSTSDAKRAYRAAYIKVIFSRSLPVALLGYTLIVGFFHAVSGGQEKYIAIIFGCYFMHIYLYSKMDFSKF